MLRRRFAQSAFPDGKPPLAVHDDLRPDRVLRRPVIGILHVLYVKALPDHRQIGIGEEREQPLLRQAVESPLLIEQQHPVPVEIPYIICQLALSGQILVAVEHLHELIVRIGVIEMVFLYAAALENPLQPVPAKGADPLSPLIVLYAGEISPQMVLLAARKIFQAIFVLYGNQDPAPRRQMAQQEL